MGGNWQSAAAELSDQPGYINNNVGLMFNFQTYSSATLIVKTKVMVAIIYHVHNTSLDNMKSLLSLREIFNWPLSETWDYIGFIYMWYVHTDLTRKPWPTPQPIWWMTNLGQSIFSWDRFIPLFPFGSYWLLVIFLFFLNGQYFTTAIILIKIITFPLPCASSLIF